MAVNSLPGSTRDSPKNVDVWQGADLESLGDTVVVEHATSVQTRIVLTPEWVQQRNLRPVSRKGFAHLHDLVAVGLLRRQSGGRNVCQLHLSQLAVAPGAVAR